MLTELYLRALQGTQKRAISYNVDELGDVIPIEIIQDIVEYEKNILFRPDPLKGTHLPDGPLQGWFGGKSGHSTTKYNPGQGYYYSPVGYILQITNDQQVLANFTGDGNVGSTCNPDFKDTKGRTSIHNICNYIMNNQAIMETILAKPGSCRDFFLKAKGNTNAVDDPTGIKYINELMSTYPDGTELGDTIRDCIRNAAINVLTDYYKETGHKGRYSGTGLTTTDEFVTAESLYKKSLPGSDVVIGKKQTIQGEEDDTSKYTECVIHGTSDNLKYIFASVDTNPIPYPSVIDAKWVIKEGDDDETVRAVIKERLKANLAYHDTFLGAKKDLKFAIVDRDGIINTTDRRADIDELLSICGSGGKDWQQRLAIKLEQNFIRVDQKPQANEAAAWETGSYSEITIVKALEPHHSSLPHHQMSISELCLNAPVELKNDIRTILSQNLDMSVFKKALKHLTLKYHSDKSAVSGPIIIALNQIRHALDNFDKHDASQSGPLSILGTEVPVKSDEIKKQAAVLASTEVSPTSHELEGGHAVAETTATVGSSRYSMFTTKKDPAGLTDSSETSVTPSTPTGSFKRKDT